MENPGSNGREFIAAIWSASKIKEKYGTTDLEELNKKLKYKSLLCTSANVDFFAEKRGEDFLLTLAF